MELEVLGQANGCKKWSNLWALVAPSELFPATLVLKQYHKVCHWSVRTNQQRVRRYLTSQEIVSRFVLEAEGIHIAVVWSKLIVCLDLFRSADELEMLPNS